jgi:hypothetical protein
MLIHDPAPRLRDRIVAHLSIHPSMSASDIGKKLNEQRSRYSQPAVYKELAILVEAGILIRSAGRYRLSLTWIFDAVSYTDSLLATMKSAEYGEDLLPAPNQSRTFRLREHAHVDRLWGQLTGTLFSKMEQPIVYQALQHRWWPLLHRDLGRQFRYAMQKSTATSICVIHGDTYLDRLFKSLFPKHPSQCAIAPDFFKGIPWPFFTVIGDYIIRATYPSVFVSELDAYFRRIRSEREITVPDVQYLFRSPGIISVRIEHRREKAGQLRRKFHRHFGMKEN